MIDHIYVIFFPMN